MESAHTWLTTFGQLLKQTLCRRGGRALYFEQGLNEVGGLVMKKVTAGASIWWAGNGGSAAICSHLSQDMLNKLGAKSIFLGDPSLLTCMSNDFGYEAVYARPLNYFVEKGDLVIVISSSGNSENILACADLAIEKKAALITLSGMKQNNQLWNRKSDYAFFVNSSLYGMVEVAHEAILHAIIEALWLEGRQEKW